MGVYSKILVNVPDINRSYVNGNMKYSSNSVISANQQIIKNIKSNLGSFISEWGNEFGVDEEILIGFIATESGGKNAPSNTYEATGYMQITPVTVYETITKWDSMVSVPLSAKTKAILKKYISNYSSWDKNKSMSNATSEAIKKASKNADFNIAMGSAIIRWLLEAFSKESSSPLNKVMISYNIGYYGSKNKLKGNLSSEQILAIRGLGKEPKAYVLKMLGKNGFLDLLFNQ